MQNANIQVTECEQIVVLVSPRKFTVENISACYLFSEYIHFDEIV